MKKQNSLYEKGISIIPLVCCVAELGRLFYLPLAKDAVLDAQWPDFWVDWHLV